MVSFMVRKEQELRRKDKNTHNIDHSAAANGDNGNNDEKSVECGIHLQYEEHSRYFANSANPQQGGRKVNRSSVCNCFFWAAVEGKDSRFYSENGLISANREDVLRE